MAVCSTATIDWAGRSLGAAPLPGEGVGGYSQRSERFADGTRVVVVSRRHSVDGQPILIRLAQSEEPVWHAVDQFLIAAALMFPADDCRGRGGWIPHVAPHTRSGSEYCQPRRADHVEPPA